MTRACAFVLASALGACTGQISDAPPRASAPAAPETPASPALPRAPTADAGGAPVPAPPAPVKTCTAAAPAPRLRRLTAFEYDNTVRDLLGTKLRPGAAFEPENAVLGFDNNSGALLVNDRTVEQYANAADALAAEAVKDLPKLLGCDPKVNERACVETFVRAFGARAFRDAMPAAEVDAYLRFFDDQRKANGLPEAVGMLVSAFLQAPAFLHRYETTTNAAAPAGWVALSPQSLAVRLSYALWGTAPDAALRAAASDGRLATKADVAREAARLLADPKAADVLYHFHAQWLQLGGAGRVEKNRELYPQFAALHPLMLEETRRFLADLFAAGDARIQSLLLGGATFANDRLAAFYGVTGPKSDAFEKVTLPAGQRAGILTQASVLAAHATATSSSIVRRGKFVLEQLLCQELVPPPANVPALPEAGAEGQPATQRARLERHRQDPQCAGCHAQLDPPGLVFERFGAAGEWRDREAGAVIDTRTTFRGVGDLDGDVADARALAVRLSTSPVLRRCLTTQWFRFVHGRKETDADACALDALAGALEASGGDLRTFLIGLTQTDAFMYAPAPRGDSP